MTTPNFDKGPSEPDPQPYGQPYGQPAGYAQPGGFGEPGGFGQPGGTGSPYGSPAPYGSAGGGVVGPGGEWLGPPLASWGLRLVGYLLDSVLAGIVVFALALVAPDAASAFNLAFLLLFGYLNGAKGQTPGKKAVGIKLLRVTDGQVIGGGAGIGRQFLHILDALPLLLGFLWPIWDKKNQTFADKIIGSVVVKA